MSVLTCRAAARCLLALLLALPLLARSADAETPLSLDEAVTLALTEQPLLRGIAAQSRVLRESAVAARQLPDPELNLGLMDLPVDTEDAYSLTDDGDTQIVVGVKQAFPRADKRRLRGEVMVRDAQRLDVEQLRTRRQVRREVALAWLTLWRETTAQRLVAAQQEDAQTQVALAEIALKTGTATQAEFLAARVEALTLADQVSASAQMIEQARSALSRWVGEAAWRPVERRLALAPPEPLPALLAQTRRHPELAAALAQRAVADTGTALARAEFQADWWLELGYGHRPAFSEMVMLQVGMDLPLFTAQRQDRKLAAALAQQDVADAAVDDVQRQLQAELRRLHVDAQRLDARLADYDAGLIPQSAARREAALIAWRNGRGLLREVIQARRDELALQLSQLGLRHALAQRQVQLAYFAVDEASATLEHPHE